MGLDPAKIHWRAFDRRGEFENDIEDLAQFSSHQFTTSLPSAIEWAETADVPTVRTVWFRSTSSTQRFASRSDCGRGRRSSCAAGPVESDPRLPSSSRAGEDRRPGVSHLWNTVFLDALRSTAKLDAPPQTKPRKRSDWNLDALAARIEHGYAPDFATRTGFVGALTAMYNARVCVRPVRPSVAPTRGGQSNARPVRPVWQ